MSLTQLLEGENCLQQFAKAHAPGKKEFFCTGGPKPFDSSSPILVKQSKYIHPGTIGTASDYMFRFMIAAYVKNNKKASLDNLKAYTGLEIIENQLTLKCNIAMRNGWDVTLYTPALKEFDKLSAKYDQSIELLTLYINNGQIDKSKLASICLWFAYLESYMRSGLEEAAIKAINYDGLPHTLEIEKLVTLADVFEDKFINTGFINPESKVLFNPDFGEYSKKLGGADADVWIDGILYDFKSTSRYGYKSKDAQQLFMYYMLYRLDQEDNKSSAISQEQIMAIALYHSRYGVINLCNSFSYWTEEKMSELISECRECVVEAASDLAKMNPFSFRMDS